MMESLEGKKGQPRFKPPFPANFGLYGKPTTINNTETYASVPAIIRNGAEWFLEPGQAEQRRPEDLLGLRPRRQARATSRSASARRSPTCWRWPAACASGRKLKAVIPGGSSMPVLPAETMMACTMDYDSHPEGRLRPGFGRGDRDGRNHLHGARLPAHRAFLLRREPAASARRAAKAPAGCTACSTRIVEGKATHGRPAHAARPPPARSKATPSAPSAKPPRGRCRASCATSGTSSNTSSSTSVSIVDDQAAGRVNVEQAA